MTLGLLDKLISWKSGCNKTKYFWSCYIVCYSHFLKYSWFKSYGTESNNIRSYEIISKTWVLKVVEMHKKQKIGDLVLLHKNLNHACFLIFPIDSCENEFCVYQTECEWVFSVGFTTYPEHFIVN